MMLMVRNGTRNIAKKTRVRITIDTSIVVKVNLLVIKALFDRASLFIAGGDACAPGQFDRFAV